MSREGIGVGAVPDAFFLRFLRGTADLAIFAVDTEGRVASWNAGAERIKGYRAEEILGKHVRTFYPPGDVVSHKAEYILRRAAEEGHYEDESWRVRKDGTMFWANAIVTAVRGDDGALMGYVKTTRDLTARRHAEEALRQSEERYRLLIASVKDYAIFILDPTGHIMSWNEGAQRLKGYTAEEVVGRHFSIFYSEADRARGHPEEELAIAVHEGRYEEEGWRFRKDGSTFWASVTITAIFDHTGKHMGFAKVTRDLTERKRAEEELRRRASAYVELNRELDAFSHSVAHDLRAPVRAVRTLVGLVLDEARSRLTPDEIQNLEAAATSADNMGRIIQDLLDLSMTGRRDPARKRVSVTALAREVFAQAQQDRPHLRARLEVEDDLVAFADEGLLRIALTNLIDNAIKYSQRASSPLVTVGRARTPRGDAFYVRDNGVGFEPKARHRLFEPFVRLHSSTDFEGTGLGLTIVKRIVDRHGGSLWAESRPGEGAIFYFSLPAGPSQAATSPR